MRMRLCALATAQGDGALLSELTTGKHTAPHARPNATRQRSTVAGAARYTQMVASVCVLRLRPCAREPVSGQ